MRKDILPFLASTVNGISLGSLVFAGAVDIRALLDVLSSGKESILKELFPVWWPCGRDLMVPVSLIGVLLNSCMYIQRRKRHDVNKTLWLLPATMHATILLWTGIVMGGTIGNLMNAKGDDFNAAFKLFCKLHFPRILFSGIGASCSTLALMNHSD